MSIPIAVIEHPEDIGIPIQRARVSIEAYIYKYTIFWILDS